MKFFKKVKATEPIPSWYGFYRTVVGEDTYICALIPFNILSQIINKIFIFLKSVNVNSKTPYYTAIALAERRGYEEGRKDKLIYSDDIARQAYDVGFKYGRDDGMKFERHCMQSQLFRKAEINHSYHFEDMRK